MSYIRGSIEVLIEKPEGKIPFGRPRYRWTKTLKNISSINGKGTWTGLICFRSWTDRAIL
jgi:hypothetical protein